MYHFYQDLLFCSPSWLIEKKIHFNLRLYKELLASSSVYVVHKFFHCLCVCVQWFERDSAFFHTLVLNLHSHSAYFIVKETVLLLPLSINLGGKPWFVSPFSSCSTLTKYLKKNCLCYITCVAICMFIPKLGRTTVLYIIL